jgi:hypothetical protein
MERNEGEIGKADIASMRPFGLQKKSLQQWRVVS